MTDVQDKRFIFRRPVFHNGEFYDFEYKKLGGYGWATLADGYSYGAEEQCTGRHDKNKKLIFENDLVYNKNIGGNTDRGVVKWDPQMLQWQVVHRESAHEKLSICLACFAIREKLDSRETETRVYCEIIGHIHHKQMVIDGQIQLNLDNSLQ